MIQMIWISPNFPTLQAAPFVSAKNCSASKRQWNKATNDASWNRNRHGCIHKEPGAETRSRFGLDLRRENKSETFEWKQDLFNLPTPNLWSKQEWNAKPLNVQLSKYNFEAEAA